MSLFNHPKNVCMTYLQHARLSLYFSYIFSKGAVLSIVHAVIPDIAVTSTSDTIKQINDILLVSGCRK